MKKSKLSTGLVTSFIAAMALSACSQSVTNGKGNVVSFTGYNGQSLSVVTDELYDQYLTSSTGISAYYQSVIEVLIRNAFNKDKAGTSTLNGIKKTYDQIVNEAKNNVKGDKNTAKENADTNGTSYKKEWQSILSGKGVKDESELLQYYIYQLEKEVIEDWYFDQHEEELTKEYLGVGDDGTSSASTKASSRFPYHIRHILIKAENGAAGFARETISASQATLLSNTIQALADGRTSFGDVAYQYSEDSSNTSYGDVGIMTADASTGSLGMVNEFQLGIYAYDAIYSNRIANSVISSGLGLDDEMTAGLYEQVTSQEWNPASVGSEPTVADTLEALGLGEVPYNKVVELGLAANIEANGGSGLAVADGKSALYPRNILWNKYFNRHNAFVITNRAEPDYAAASDAKATIANDNVNLKTGEVTSYSVNSQTVESYDSKVADATIDFTKLSGLKANSKLSTDSNFRVLEDENSNVIIGVRSQYGIHLMVVQKSIYDYNNGEGSNVSLEEYYTTAVPGDSDYPVDDNGNDKNTYVNFIQSANKSDANTRAETVRSAIKGFDKTYDYRLYDALSGKDDGTRSSLFDTSSKGYKLLESIDNYVATQRTKNVYEQGENLQEVWKTYLELISAQNEVRVDINSTENYRMVPEGCKIRFYDGQYDTSTTAYDEGGACYVKE
ncbi:MAG: peptidylprolyl isomerase [Bacilli bacterium]|nr:peptidylprolyl isomerase [Bacilli bacterium]